MMKKLDVSFFLNAFACLFTLVAWITLMVTNSVEGHAIENGNIAIVLGIIAVLLIAAGTFVTMKFGSQHFITAFVKLAGFVCLMIMLAILLMDRAILASAVFTWAQGNAIAEKAFAISVVSAAFAIVATILLIVTAFMNNKKKEA